MMLFLAPKNLELMKITWWTTLYYSHNCWYDGSRSEEGCLNRIRGQVLWWVFGFHVMCI